MGRLTDPKDTLLEAAKNVLIERGLEGLNARAIAQKAGCAVGTLYNHYKNMTEIILTINFQTLSSLKEELQGVFKKKSKEERSTFIYTTYLSFAKRNLPFWNLLYEYKLPSNEKLPGWYQKIVNELFETVEKGLKTNLPKDPYAASLAIGALWAGLQGILMLELTGKLGITSNIPAEALCDSLFDKYLKE